MPPRKKTKETVEEQNINPIKTMASVEKEAAELEAIYGELEDLAEEEDHFFPSGSFVIDTVLSNGKGVPLGKFISINSEAGTGKSSMCLHIARNCCAKGFRCLYIDTETGLNKSQLDSFGMLPFVANRTFIPKTAIRTYRELDDLLSKVLKDDSLKFIFIDSLTDLLPDQFLETNISDVNQPALEAVAQSRILKKYKYSMCHSGKTIFFVLQNRTKIAMSYGQQTTVQAAGGKAVAYHMDIALELKKIEELTKTVKGHAKPVPYGSRCFLQSNKNRYAMPKIPMEIQIIYGKGVSNSGAIANALILEGIARQPTKLKYAIDYQGEEHVLMSRAKFEEFIKEHLSYYKEIVEGLGGIRLVREEEEVKPNSDNIENAIEELSNPSDESEEETK